MKFISMQCKVCPKETKVLQNKGTTSKDQSSLKETHLLPVIIIFQNGQTCGQCDPSHLPHKRHKEHSSRALRSLSKRYYCHIIISSVIPGSKDGISNHSNNQPNKALSSPLGNGTFPSAWPLWFSSFKSDAWRSAQLTHTIVLKCEGFWSHLNCCSPAEWLLVSTVGVKRINPANIANDKTKQIPH